MSTVPLLIIDRKEFRVMSILHRTYRVTRLRVIYLLNSRQGVWEIVTGIVSETTEKFRREHRKCFGKTEKLFRSKPLSQIGFGSCLELFRGTRIVLGTSGIFPEKKPEMFRSSQNYYVAFRWRKSLFRKCFRNTSRIVLVGTRIVLGLHKDFRI